MTHDLHQPASFSLPWEETGTPQKKSDLPFLKAHPAHWIALGFGSGLSPLVPGTMGTLFGWVSFNLLLLWVYFVSLPLLGILIALAFLAGIWASHITAENLQSDDPGCIVWDEVVAFWWVLACLPITSSLGQTFLIQLIAFILFRLFDMVKIGPVRWADQYFAGQGVQGAFGIMVDDIVAALLTIILMHIGLFIFL